MSQYINYPTYCTIITISKGDSVFFGGNDDYINPDSYYFVEKADSSRYGVIWIGTPDNPQQGINEMGLAYDANGLPRVDVNPHPERLPVPGEYHNYVMQIMHECSTVEEVIAWINIHQRFPYMHDQLHFADNTGDAVIVCAGKDGEIVFIRKAPGDGFLVSTNFNVANPSFGSNYPCWRYDLAQKLLPVLIDKPEPISYRDLTVVMDSVHMEGLSWTIETLVADLVNGVIYIYYFHQYHNPVIINVKEELENPREAGPLSSLFPEDLRMEAAKRYNQYTSTAKVNRMVGVAWLSLIIISLGLLFILHGRKKGLTFWIIAAIVLGPIALMAKLLTLDSRETSICRDALIETVGDLIPLVVAFLISQVIMVTNLVEGGMSQLQQLLLMFSLPLLIAWIIFHGILLASAGKKDYIKLLFQRLPQVLTTTFLGLAGILPVALPLETKSLVATQITPLSPWIVMTWWAIIVLGSLVGGLLIFVYEHWAVKRGFHAWAVLAGNGSDITTPKFSKIWWCILISILITLVMLVGTVMLLKFMSV